MVSEKRYLLSLVLLLMKYSNKKGQPTGHKIKSKPNLCL